MNVYETLKILTLLIYIIALLAAMGYVLVVILRKRK